MIVLPVLMALRAVTAFMFAAGLGGLVAAVVSRSLATSVTFAWAASLPGFGLTLACIFLPAALGASLLMPARIALVRDIRGEPDPPLPGLLTIALVVLCAAAALQVPALLAWWVEVRSLVAPVVPGGPDPLGFNAAATVMLFSRPTLAAMTLATFGLTSLLVIAVPGTRASRALMACVVLQAGLVAGEWALVHEVHTLETAVLPALTAAGDTATAGAISEWIARYDLAGAFTHRSLPLILIGYAVALALAVSLGPHPARATAGDSTARLEAEPPALDARGPEPDLPRVSSISAAATVFDDSSYSVHPRMTLVESLLTRKCSNYEIRTIPPTSRGRFSFSWDTGVVRREPNGPDVLSLEPSRPPGLFSSHPYAVIETGTGGTLASLVPRGADWEIVHPSGDSLARVLRTTGGPGIIGYSGMVGEHEVCRFKWTLNGLSVASAELEVEFLPVSGVPFDRALALALAPILEQKARLASERSRS